MNQKKNNAKKARSDKNLRFPAKITDQTIGTIFFIKSLYHLRPFYISNQYYLYQMMVELFRYNYQRIKIFKGEENDE